MNILIYIHITLKDNLGYKMNKYLL